MTNKSKKIVYWTLDAAYAIIFGLFIGADLGIDISKKLEQHFG